MARCCPVFSRHSADFADLTGVRPVLQIIDEIGGDDPRPVRVEDRHCNLLEKVVSNAFYSLSAESMEPVHCSVVTGSVVVVSAGFPDGRLIDCCKGDSRPDLAGIEGRVLDSR